MDRPQQDESFFQWNAHTKSTAALCTCIGAMSYLIISVFPYSGFMAIDLIPGVDEETAGLYAGLIASSFMAGRALSSYHWGLWTDVYGRKFALLASLGLSCLFSLLFGMSRTFHFALLSRFFLGLSNSVMGTVKTAVSELAMGNEKLEKRGMGLVVGMWGWGFLWGPALGGFLAEPVKQYPKNAFVQTYANVLGRYPFLLPNIVGMLLCVLAILAVEEWVPETLPRDKLRNPTKIPSDFFKWTKKVYRKWCRFCVQPATVDEERTLIAASAAIANRQDDDDEEEESLSAWTSDNIQELQMRHSESGSMLSTQVVDISPRPSLIHVRTSVAQRLSISTATSDGRRRSSEYSYPQSGITIASIWNRIDTRVHLIVYWLFSFLQTTADEAFPLYCISKEGGLGLSESSIGKLLSGSGLVFAICQYFVYASIVNRVGLYESLQIGSLCLSILVLIPFSVLLKNEDAWSSYLYLCIVLAASRILSSVFFSSIFIALNRTVPASHRATMNGLQTLGGSVGKGLGPTFAGLLVAFSLSSGVFPPRVGGFFIWIMLGSMGVVFSLAVTLLLKEEEADPYDEASIETERLTKK